MERKVARAKGERTLEERKDLDRESNEAQAQYNIAFDEHTQIYDSLKKLDDDLRSVEKKLIVVKKDKDNYDKIS